MSENLLQVMNIKKSFSQNEVLKGISFFINKGDVIAVLGPSGSGKTTLLRCINFLELADSGKLIFDNTEYDFTAISKKDIADIRKKTAFVFQDFNLFRNKTVLQNITEGLVVARKMKRDQAKEIGLNMLEKVGLKDKADSFPHELSGGQQQRVAIARALATDPEIIYFDEPTSALDPELTVEVLEVIKNLAKEGMTMIIVTHEMNFAKNVSSKIIFLEGGLIIEENDSKQFFESPKNTRMKKYLEVLQ